MFQEAKPAEVTSAAVQPAAGAPGTRAKGVEDLDFDVSMGFLLILTPAALSTDLYIVLSRR